MQIKQHLTCLVIGTSSCSKLLDENSLRSFADLTYWAWVSRNWELLRINLEQTASNGLLQWNIYFISINMIQEQDGVFRIGSGHNIIDCEQTHFELIFIFNCTQESWIGHWSCAQGHSTVYLIILFLNW